MPMLLSQIVNERRFLLIHNRKAEWQDKLDIPVFVPGFWQKMTILKLFD